MSRFHHWARESIRLHPAPDGKPIRVLRFTPKDRSLGQTTRGTHYWTISVHRALPDVAAWLVFLHELAHVHAWNESDPIDHSCCGDPSCRHWGCWFARLWREHHYEGDHWLD